MDNRVWVKDAVMTIRLPEEVDHFVYGQFGDWTGDGEVSGDGADWREGESGACGRADAEDSGDVGGDAGD